MTGSSPENSLDPLGIGVVVAGQQAATAILRRMVTRTDSCVVSPLLLQGPAGHGKTHLLDAVARATANWSRVHWNGAEVKRHRREELRSAFLEKAAASELLMIDDVDSVEDCDELGEELSVIIDRCVMRGAWVVATSRSPIRTCSTMSPRLRERLGEGVAVGLRAADLNERCALVRHFCGNSGLTSEVIDWLSARVSANLRRLRSCALQLISVQKESRTQLDVGRARVVLEEVGLLEPATLAAGAGEVPPPSRRMSGVFASGEEAAARKTRFKQMLTEAETDDEKRLALEIALGERLREFRSANVTDERRTRFERALSLLRSGNLEDALKYIA